VIRLIDAAGMGEPPMSLRDRALLELLYGTGAHLRAGWSGRRRPRPGRADQPRADQEQAYQSGPIDGHPTTDGNPPERPALLKLRGKGSKSGLSRSGRTP
jgi:hypothetical protein